MRKSMMKSSVLMAAFMLFFSISIVYAASNVANGTYNSNHFDISLWKNGSNLTSHEDSMANRAVVPNSQELEVTGTGATLTFDIQKIYFLGIPGNLTGLSVDFNGNGNYTDAVVANNKVVLNIPLSELTQEKHVYPAKVSQDVIFSMTKDIEFYIDLSNCN